ncbi:MAG: S26 family signal peptidase, partial [Pseudomonadales bacterium]
MTENFSPSKDGQTRLRMLRGFWREAQGIIAFLAVMVLFRSAVADWNQVPTGSMKPTILEGDRVIVNKL